jgi:hypothetical protein
MKKKTVWSIFRDLVNSKEIGSIITRQEMLFYIECGLRSIPEMNERYHKGFDLFSPATFDCARNMSEKVGYLAKTDTTGIYKVVKHFDSDYTVSQLRKDYDNGNYCKNQSDK